MVDDVDAATDRGVLVCSSARAVRRSLRPVVWMVLEDVLLDAVWRNGRLVASTSGRLVAEHLGIDTGTAASALRVLRDRGVVQLAQTFGPDGRFGLAVYTVRLPPGVEVLAPGADPPRMVQPHTVNPDAVRGVSPNPPVQRRRPPASTTAGQRAFDLGLGSG